MYGSFDQFSAAAFASPFSRGALFLAPRSTKDPLTSLPLTNGTIKIRTAMICGCARAKSIDGDAPDEFPATTARATFRWVISFCRSSVGENWAFGKSDLPYPRRSYRMTWNFLQSGSHTAS